MFRAIKEKWYLLGYIIIMYGICRFGYICFYFIRALLNNKERTVIGENSIHTIGKMQFNYTNIILVIAFYFITSTVLTLLGITVVKKLKVKKLKS